MLCHRAVRNVRIKRWIVAVMIAASTATPAWAQSAASSQDAAASPGQTEDQAQKPVAAAGEEGTKPTRRFVSALAHNLKDDLKHVPRWNTVYWLAGGGAAALAVHPADTNINGRLINKTTDGLWKPGHILGATEFLLPAAAATYFLGRHINAPRVQHLGMDEIEAAILSEAFVETLKYAIRRDRPAEIGGPQSHTYSFPSGHATLTFAMATVLQQHLGYRAAIPTYALATYVAMSRLHDNRHYASDVVFGAALGVVIGRSVTWHGRNFYASPMLMRDGAGIQIAMAH
jgi:membrane-associated phospholipid phosphatase